MSTKELIINISLCVLVILYLSLFIYSGVNKIKGFQDASKGLETKLGVSNGVAKFGLGSVIFLEVILSIAVILFFLTVPFLKNTGKISQKTSDILSYVVIAILALFIVFMITITIIYHPPKDGMGTFLSKLTVTAGFGFIILYLVSILE